MHSLARDSRHSNSIVKQIPACRPAAPFVSGNSMASSISHPEQLIAKPTTSLSHSCRGAGDSRSRLLLSFVPCDEQMFDRSENNGYTLQHRLPFLWETNNNLWTERERKTARIGIYLQENGCKINSDIVSYIKKKRRNSDSSLLRFLVTRYMFDAVDWFYYYFYYARN